MLPVALQPTFAYARPNADHGTARLHLVGEPSSTPATTLRDLPLQRTMRRRSSSRPIDSDAA